MAINTRIRLTGVESIKRKMDQIGNPRILKRIVNKSARKAMLIVRDAAKVNAKLIDDRKTVDKIWKNITISTSRLRNPYVSLVRVGIRGGASFGDGKTTILTNKDFKNLVGPMQTPKVAGLPGGDTRHWRWIEYGTEDIRPRPFMQPALYNNITKVIDIFTTDFSKELDMEIQKIR